MNGDDGCLEFMSSSKKGGVSRESRNEQRKRREGLTCKKNQKK